MSRLEDFFEETWQFYRQPLKAFTKTIVKRYDEYLVRKGLLNTTSKLQTIIQEPKEIKLEKYPPKKKSSIFDGKKKIAFIHEEVGHVSGGRYYSYFIISALMEMGHDVTVYTNRKPVFSDDFELYKKPKVKIAASVGSKLSGIDCKADIYVGSPAHGVEAAIRLGKKYNKPSVALIFDPIPMAKKYANEGKWPGFERMIKQIRENEVHIISLCNETTKWICPWLKKTPDNVHPLYPCLNSRVYKTKKRNYKREKYAVFVSRIVPRKRFEDIVKAVKISNIPLKVITTIDLRGAQAIVKKHNATKLIDFYIGLDDSGKFDMIRKSSVMINASIFEGFGMYFAEAIMTGTPFVGYEYPTFTEIAEYAGADNIYLAKPKDYKDLSKKLDQAIKENKTAKQSDMFDFDKMVERLKNI